MGGSGPGKAHATPAAAARFPFDGVLADLRIKMAASKTNGEKERGTRELIESLARAAKAEGMTPEKVVVAVRKAWEQDATHTLLHLEDGADVERHRVIGALLDAYFADR